MNVSVLVFDGAGTEGGVVLRKFLQYVVVTLAVFIIVFVLLGIVFNKKTSPEAADLLDHYAIEREMTLDFSFGQRSGIYTGAINDAGLPDGVGTFSSENGEGVHWVYMGEWDNGHWNDVGYTKFDDGVIVWEHSKNDVSDGYGIMEAGDVVRIGDMYDRRLRGYGIMYLTNGVFFGGFDASENASGIFIDENDMTFYAQIIDGTLYTQPADDVLAAEPAATPAATPTPRPAPSNTPAPIAAPDPAAAIEDDLRGHIEAEYSMTTIDRITINEDYGTDLDDDYVALVYLTWTQKNSGDLSKTMLTMYSDDLAAWAADNCPDVQELAVFWTVPYLDADAKRSYERRDGGMFSTDSVFGDAFN
mgnify:CR=1 FL=1